MNKKYITVLLFFIIFNLNGCSDSSSGGSDLGSSSVGSTPDNSVVVPEETQKYTEEEVVESAKEFATSLLIDPLSVLFRDVQIVSLPKGGEKGQYYKGFKADAYNYYVCGQLNGKNRFGGYVGFKGFNTFIYYNEEDEKFDGVAIFQDNFLYDIGYDHCRNAI